MSKAEVTACESFLHSSDFAELSEHAVDRMSFYGIDRRMVTEALAKGQIIEVSKNRYSIRGLTRYSFGSKDLCVVFTFTDRTVVTAWWNDPDDYHAGLDLNQYRWTVDLVQLLKEVAVNTGHTLAVCAINRE